MIEKTLYVLHLHGTVTDSLYMLYAVDDQEAEDMSVDLARDHNASRVSLQAMPRGFRIVHSELAGVIQVPDEPI